MCHQPLEANISSAERRIGLPLHRLQEPVAEEGQEGKENHNCWLHKNPKKSACFTVCQIRLHDTVDSAWLVAGKNVYDVTNYLPSHPGGVECILKYAGGKKDVTEDLHFHSARGRKLWDQYKIGTVADSDSSSSWPDRIKHLLCNILNQRL